MGTALSIFIFSILFVVSTKLYIGIRQKKRTKDSTYLAGSFLIE